MAKGTQRCCRPPEKYSRANFLVLSAGTNPWRGGGSRGGGAGMGAHPRPREAGAHPGTRGLGRHPLPSADTRGWQRGNAPASRIIPRGRSRCLFRPQGTRGRVVAGAGSDPCGDPQKCHSGSSPTPTGPRRPRGVVTKFVEMNLERARGSAAAARGRRDEWPEGMGWAPPAAAQMFLRGTPPLLWSLLGRAGPEGARGGGSCSPLVSQLNN